MNEIASTMRWGAGFIAPASGGLPVAICGEIGSNPALIRKRACVIDVGQHALHLICPWRLRDGCPSRTAAS